MVVSGPVRLGIATLTVLAVAAGGAAWVGPRANAPSALTATVPGTSATPEKTLWKDLTPSQRTALEPLAAEWDQVEPVRKQKWLAIAKRYTAMKPDEQLRVQERMREWVRMTPDERRQVRENFARAQKVAPSKKSTDWENYQQLPDEQKKQLAARSANKKQLASLATPSQSKQQQLAAPIKPHVAMPPAAPTTPAASPAPAPWLDPATGQPWPDASNIAPVIAPAPPPITPPSPPDAIK
jgi:Protein of unknown function (DUF3106)